MWNSRVKLNKTTHVYGNFVVSLIMSYKDGRDIQGIPGRISWGGVGRGRWWSLRRDSTKADRVIVSNQTYKIYECVPSCATGVKESE